MNSSKGAVGSAAETLVWEFYPSGMWGLLNKKVCIIQCCGKKKTLESKWAKCATAVTWEEKAINSFEGLQVNFFPACLLYG